MLPLSIDLPKTQISIPQVKSEVNIILIEKFQENITANLALQKLINRQMSVQECSFDGLSEEDAFFILDDFQVQWPAEYELAIQFMPAEGENLYLKTLQNLKNSCFVETVSISDSRQAVIHSKPITVVTENGMMASDALATNPAFSLSKTLHYQSADLPPIRELNFEDANAAIEIMKINMTGWDFVPVPDGNLRAENIDQYDWNGEGEKRTVQERWNNRIEDTRWMLHFPLASNEETKIFAYYVDDTPIGIMVMKNTTQPQILQIVTHPGSEGAGGSLIEKAVNQSMAWRPDSSGVVSLWALNDNTRQAYYAMGFSNRTGLMVLKPDERHDKFVWVEDAAAWRLKSNLGKGYIHSCSKQDTSS